MFVLCFAFFFAAAQLPILLCSRLLVGMPLIDWPVNVETLASAEFTTVSACFVLPQLRTNSNFAACRYTTHSPYFCGIAA